MEKPMGKYKCKNCGYDGDELIFQFNDYTYCLASNEKNQNILACALTGLQQVIQKLESLLVVLNAMLGVLIILTNINFGIKQKGCRASLRPYA